MKVTSRSMEEEKIACLWSILAVIAYQADIQWIVWLAGFKAVLDHAISIYFARKELAEKKLQDNAENQKQK
jgi:hypothetical protein